MTAEEKARRVFPDSLVGTDSHTTAINGLGISAGASAGWAEAVMLDQPIPSCPK